MSTRVLVTGATGLIGFNVVQQLLADGRDVTAMVRSIERAEQVVPAACSLVQGDVTDKESILAAMEGCEVVYHIAGMPEQWLPDTSLFDHVNAGGTRNMVEAALAHGVKRFVYTSTIDVFAAETGGAYDESTLDDAPKGTHYERSKQEADRIVTAALDGGLPAVFLHPSALYGPGPLGTPNLNQFFVQMKQGEIPMLLPGELPVVFAPDVARGHILAEEKAQIGDRFILSESQFTLAALAAEVATALGLPKVPPVMPLWVAKLVSSAGEALAKLTKKPPLIPAGQLTFLQWRARPQNDRAREVLDWQPTPFQQGLTQTLQFLGILDKNT